MKLLSLLVLAATVVPSPAIRGEERRDKVVFAEKKDARNDAIRAEVRKKEEPPQKKRMLRSADLYTRALLKTGRLAGEMIGVPVQYVDEVRKAIKGWSGEDEPKKTRTGR